MALHLSGFTRVHGHRGRTPVARKQRHPHPRSLRGGTGWEETGEHCCQAILDRAYLRWRASTCSRHRRRLDDGRMADDRGRPNRRSRSPRRTAARPRPSATSTSQRSVHRGTTTTLTAQGRAFAPELAPLTDRTTVTWTITDADGNRSPTTMLTRRWSPGSVVGRWTRWWSPSGQRRAPTPMGCDLLPLAEQAIDHDSTYCVHRRLPSARRSLLRRGPTSASPNWSRISTQWVGDGPEGSCRPVVWWRVRRAAPPC